ncbi:MAG: HigA family addiction module antitoxin [Ramlibacter sp.]
MRAIAQERSLVEALRNDSSRTTITVRLSGDDSRIVLCSATQYNAPMNGPSRTEFDTDAGHEVSPIHPGVFVRAKVLNPRGLSVVRAAKLVGVSRPALNNFLNGHVATTSEMATRIEAAFGFPAARLLDMQAAFDAATTSTANVAAGVTPYTVPFLGIKARDIEAWASRNIQARSRFAVLLRTLVNSTGRGITSLDFPGNDDAERPGWDGQLDITEGTPWIPAGSSGWEFGTNEDPKAKAESDYAKSTKATSKADRAALTFVFVTPRAWPGKNEWSALKRVKHEWRDVRAYDSSDLEQWIEQSIAAQLWFAHEVGKPSLGVRTLSQCWSDWANVAEPPLPGSLFSHAIERSKKTLLARLTQNSNSPVVVMADSTEEALAFVAHFFETVIDPKIVELRDRVLVFDDPGTAKKLAQGTSQFVAVVHNRAVERDLASLSQNVRCIVVYPRNAANIEPDIVLEPLNYEQFKTSLEGVGYTRDEVTRLDNESGRSLTVLRRRLARTPGVRLPEWATDVHTASSLVPFLLVGAWNATRPPDQTVLSLLGGDMPYELLERTCQRLAQGNDPPMWSAGHYRGVASKIDALFAIAGEVTRTDLERFFTVAHIVLGEDDPKLDLPDEEQWAAAIHGKSREFSGTLRRSIAETLVLLSVHGHHLFFDRLGFDCEVAAQKLVRALLTPLKTRLLEANDTDLTAYAEAAPNEFLDIIESDLRQVVPETYGLMRPAGAGLFGGGCPRTGLLWALEGLSWSPATMPRAALILAQLSQIEINDNWVNRPINSLKAIFRAWMPQTATSHDIRLRVLQQLAGRFPAVAWNVCIDQLGTGPQHGSYSHKPKWRNDGHGYGEPLSTWAPIMTFVHNVVEMVLGWKHGHTTGMVCDLVNCLPGLAAADRERVWTIIEAWAASASDSDKAIVREQIRKRLLTRRGKPQANNDDFIVLTESAKRVREALEPADLLQKHEWLFRTHWVEESAEELVDDSHDYEKREERVAALRTDALREVHLSRGPAGVADLADYGNAHYDVGYLYAGRILDLHGISNAIRAALAPERPSTANARRLLIAGLITGCSDPLEREALLDRLSADLSEENYVRVLLSAPFRRSTWLRVDALREHAQRTYWTEVFPDWVRESTEEAAEALDRLIAAKRPRAAFHSAQFNLEKFDPELLFCLMTAIAKDSEEPEGQFRLQQHYIEKAFERINDSTALTLDQKAGLEYLYIDALAKPHTRAGNYGIPNLATYVAAHPELYVQAIVYVYKRRDGGSDPAEFSVPDEQITHFAEQGYKLLSGIETLPGRDEQGQLTTEGLRVWVKAVRNACEGLGRLEVADINIGELVAHAPVGADGVWPCEPVRDVLEEIHSDAMMRGVQTGQFNARGAHWRGEGGAQERELADKYRGWAEALQYSHPYVASKLLMGLVRTYEHDARREDAEAIVQRRLH